MKTIEYKVSYEKMISRIPGLFAYLESDEYGVVSLHKATDSLDGCWGKIVENIELPETVKLSLRTTHIVTREDVNFNKEWYNSIGDVIILNDDDIGNEINVYNTIILPIKEKRREEEIVISEYSFRTLIDYYYQYKDSEEINYYYQQKDDETTKITKEEFNEIKNPKLRNKFKKISPFVDFIERGIGKIEVGEFKGKTKDTPKFLYLSNVKRLYNELVKTSKKCDFYNNCKDDFCDDKYLCCLCENYKKIGGNGFRDYVGELIQEAEKIAEEYKGYAVEGMTLDFDIDLTSTYQDLGIMTPYAPIWLPYKRYYEGDKVIYNDKLYRCTKENSGIWDEELLSVVFDEKSFEIVNNEMGVFDTDPTDPDNPQKGNKIPLPQGGYPIKNRTDSKLVDLRRFVTFYDDNGVASLPKGEDWLFYYRVGVPVNIKTLNDDLGNIIRLSDLKTASTNPDDLAAYGDVIESIDKVDNENKIKFTYRVGAHLKGENIATEIDSDGNKLVKWGNFVWDGDEKTGIKYEEEYTYDIGSDLDNLIKGEFTLDDDGIQEDFTFDGYIQGQYDKKLKSFNFAFRTDSNRINYDRQIANQDVNIVSLMTDYTIYRKDFDEYANNELFREDYFNGITYKPTKVIDVNINRGSTNVFDKHMAFGEIKTLEDMEQYKNNSFFKMSL